MMIKWKKILKRNFDLSTWLEFDEVFFQFECVTNNQLVTRIKQNVEEEGALSKFFKVNGTYYHSLFRSNVVKGRRRFFGGLTSNE